MIKSITNNGEKSGYYLKLDISKYYYRIDHNVLIDILRKRLGDAELLNLLERIIKSDTKPFGLPLGGKVGETSLIFGVGMPIGNLSSQMFANIYLNELDQYVKRQLRIHYYVRYMDDMIILADSKEQLHEWKMLINQFVTEKLKLELNEKTVIRPLSLGVEFCGYRIYSTHTRLRRSTSLRIKRRLKFLKDQYNRNKIDLSKIRESISSYNGVFVHCNSHNLSKKIFGVQTESERFDGWFYLQRGESG